MLQWIKTAGESGLLCATPVAYMWHLTHAAWNKLCHILWGNTARKSVDLVDSLRDMDDDVLRTGSRRFLAVHGGKRAGVYIYSGESEHAYRGVPRSHPKGFQSFEDALKFAATGWDTTLDGGVPHKMPEAKMYAVRHNGTPNRCHCQTKRVRKCLHGINHHSKKVMHTSRHHKKTQDK